MNRKTKVLKTLNIEKEELSPVLLLIVQSIFLGVFYGAFDIGAHTLFLKTFPEDMIPKAYIVSGIVGILLTASFSKLQSKISFTKLARYSLLFIALLTFLMRFSFELTDAPWTIMVVFIFLGPLNIIGILAFWGTAGRIFNLRQGKRLFGIIDAGQIFGIILSSYIIPLVLVYLKGTNNLLVISAVSVMLAMLLEIIITSKYKIDVEEPVVTEAEVTVKEKEEQIKLIDFRKNPYLLYMALFVAFSMFAAFFVQYSFLVVTNENYPVEEDMAKFLGFFTGTMMVFTFLIKTFVYSKLMKTYGLKISLLLSSVLLALFTGIAIVSGIVSGYEVHTTGFIYFFLFLSLGKLFNKTLKDALEVPSFKLLYQSLSKRIRFDIQAKIDGTVNELAALTSGILLSVLGLLAFIKLIHFSVVLFAILIIWAFITIRLYKEYKNSLEKALKAKTKNSETSDVEIIANIIIEKSKSRNDLNVRIKNIKRYLPNLYGQFLTHIVSTDKNSLDAFDYELKIDMFFQKGIDKDWTKTVHEYTLKDLSYAFSQSNYEETIQAINYIRSLSDKNRFTIISALLRTPSLNTQRIAIKLCGMFNESDACPTLVEFIESEKLLPDSVSILNKLAPIAYKQLIQVFFRTDLSIKAQMIIIDALGNVDDKEVITFLKDNLFGSNIELVSKSINALIKLHYKADSDVLSRLFPQIIQIANYMAWDISAIASVGEDNRHNQLVESLNEELKNHQKLLFNILKICYDSQSVEHVQNYLDSKSSEGIGYGLELFDMFLSEEIKPVILLLFDDMRLEDKAFQLESFFAVEISSIEKLILKIINRDPNLISKRTKKIALSMYIEYFDEIKDDILAQLFSSVDDLQFLAARTIIKLNETTYQSVLKRVEIKNRKNLEKNLSIDKKANYSFLALDKVLNKIVLDLDLQNESNCQLDDEFEYNILLKDKNISLQDQVNEYFVFLIVDQINLNEYSINNTIVYNYDSCFNVDELTISETSIIVGIKRIKMYDLVAKNRFLVQNLLKLS